MLDGHFLCWFGSEERNPFFAFDTLGRARYSPAPRSASIFLPATVEPSACHDEGATDVPKRPIDPALPQIASLSSAPRSVLLVESSAEEREVLRTVLETRGLRIWEAEGTEEGLEIARQEQPDVIVLDLESQWADRAAVQARFENASAAGPASLVILGKARRSEAAQTGHVVAKPYHFAPLVRTIERLAAAKAA